MGLGTWGWKTTSLRFVFSDNFYLISSPSLPKITSICPTTVENKFVQTTSWHGTGQCAKQDVVANTSTFLQRQIALLPLPLGATSNSE